MMAAREPLRAVWREGRVRWIEADGALYHRLDVEVAGLPSAAPGQFVLMGFGSMANAPADPLLPRPMSILDAGPEGLSVLFKIFGRGTAALAALAPGDPLRILGPLGRPFSLSPEPAPLLVGGGVGIPPLHFLSQVLSERNIDHRLLFGFNRAAEIPEALLATLSRAVELCTLDGSAGWRGHPVAKLASETDRPPSFIRACGPTPMLEALAESRRPEDRLELSLEEKMACGVGVCRGCVVPVRDAAAEILSDDGKHAGSAAERELPAQGEGGWHYETVCREGPVFAAERLYRGAVTAAVDMAPSVASRSHHHEDGVESANAPESREESP